MNKKILATILALGMVMTGFSLLVPAADETPVPSTVPNVLVNPFMADVTTVAFSIVGVCDIAVDVEVEVGSVDFLPGAGNVGVFTTALDNYATGIFKVSCVGLVEGTNYYWRAAITNGADTIYYPDATTTSGPNNIGLTGPPVTNPNTLEQVQDRPTNTNQGDFLAVVIVDNTWPLSLITDGTGIAAFTDNNLRDQTTGLPFQTAGGENYYCGAWGMWDDGSGMAFWYNDTASGVYVGVPAPFASVKTDGGSPGQSALAIGPIGSGGPLIDIAYSTIGFSSVEDPSPLGTPGPSPSTIPNVLVNPFMADVTTVAFSIVGVCDIAVDVEVEVGSVDFLPGAGNVGVFTTALDNYATGIFKVSCVGLVEGTNYYWRAAITNGADTLYYPDATTTSGPNNIGLTGPPVTNPNTLEQVQDRPTNTNQGDFLAVVIVDNTWPLSLITDGTGIAAFTDNNLRDQTTGLPFQTAGGENYYCGAWGMWDDGSGMAFWYNDTASGVYVGVPAPFASVKTDGMLSADQVDIYYTVDANATWNVLGFDITPLDGLFAIDLDTLAGPGFWYGWICNANLGDDDVGIPAGGTPYEAGPFWYGAGGMPPETHTLGAAPLVHNGNVVTDFVTLTGVANDSMHVPPDVILNAEVSVDGAAADFMAPSDGAFDTITEGVTFDYWFPPGFTEGVHTYSMHSSDVVDGWNLTVPWPSATFTVTDTTDPLGDYTPLSPADGVSRAIGSTANIYVWYEDFTAYSAATIYWWNFTEGFRANSAPMINNSFAWNSYYNTFVYGLGIYGAPGETIFYEVDLTDSAATAPGPYTITLAQRTIIPLAPVNQPQDPYPIYGFTYQYDGTSAGGYLPTLIPGCDVTVTWMNTSTGAWSTIATVSNGLAQYSVDILNYTDGEVVYCNVTVNPVYGNLGYNWTLIEAVAFPGGRWQDIICGVPWNVTILQPLDLAVVYASTPFDIEYIITDRNGLLAPGYFSYILPDPDGGYVNLTCGPIIPALHSYVAPPDKIYEGTADPDPGHFIALGGITIFYPGDLWYINASEGGQVFPDTYYLTPWGPFWLDPGLTIEGWLKDWDNITVYVTIGGFDWLLTAGWNIVSCPQDGLYRDPSGVNAFFDSQDALNWTNLYMINFLALPGDPTLGMAARTGGNPSTYASYDIDTGEGSAFAIDTTSGYWVYTSLAGPNIIHFDGMNATCNPTNNTVTVAVAQGWNLLGFQHNYTGGIGWITIPTASMFTDGTIDDTNWLWNILIGGATLNKIVVTQWTLAKWYNSYVTDNAGVGFPGMPAHNWAWNMFSANPGNGYWLWVDAGNSITYNVDF